MPCIRDFLPDNRMEFKVKAPDAKKVQIDLGRKYDLVRNAEGEWSGTTDPLAPGFPLLFPHHRRCGRGRPCQRIFLRMQHDDKRCRNSLS